MSAFGSEYAERPGWSRLQRAYIRLFGVVDLPTRIRARHVRWALGSLPWRIMYDLGCGTGVWSFFFSRDRAKSILASDIDQGRVADCEHITRRLGRRNLALEAGTAEAALGGRSGEAADVLLAIEVLNCVPDLQQTLSLAHSALKPGGWLVAHVPIRTEQRPFETYLFSEDVIQREFQAAGFDRVLCRPTFGPAARSLVRAFEQLAGQAYVLAAAYPFLLLIAWIDLIPGQGGDSRLILARRP